MALPIAAAALFPLHMLRLLLRILCLYPIKVRVDGDGSIPAAGPALLVANHVAFFDALIIFAISRRKVRFMVHENFFRFRIMRLFFRLLGVIAVPAAEKTRSMRRFLGRIHEFLRNGDVVCVFPEGGISDNGLLQHFKGGLPAMIPPGADIPIIPIRLGMLWGRLFTLHENRLRYIPPRRWPIIVSMTIGKPVSPELTGFQLRQIISELGAESECKPFPNELPLHAEFARRARRRPWRITYKDFEADGIGNFAMLVRALILSKKIRALDPDHEDGYVGVLLPNCTALAATLLGIMYADRTPTILNYSAGGAALAKAVAKARVKVVLTSRKFLAKLQLETSPEMVFLEDVAAQVTRSEKIRTALWAALLPHRLLLKKFSPRSQADLDREAVLLFSSGSTGEPKGVMLTFRNITCDIFSFWRGINWSPEDRIIGCLPLFHAFGFTVCFAFPTISGTRTVFLPNILDDDAVRKLIEREKITLMITTPTFLQSYIRRAQPHQLKSIRLLITGAEKLRTGIIDRFRELTGLSIVEGYGCTELSPIVAVNLSQSFLTLGRYAGKPGSIGVALPGIHVKIVDPDTGEELPPDTPGMMLVKGGNVMKGYLDDPEGTAKVIRDGYYVTGDIAAMGTDGHITISGRQSRFSKIGGEMVPHELIEQNIAEIAGGEDRCFGVSCRPDEKRGEKLVVFHTIPDLDADRIIAGLRERRLPNLWIPKAEDFIFIDKLPLLGSGKLDLRQLSRMALETGEKNG